MSTAATQLPARSPTQTSDPTLALENTVQAPRPVSRTVTAFLNVSVVPMDTERVLVNQTVLVEGSRITAVGSVDSVRVPAGAVRIDGRGKYLLPGLADMHAHLSWRGHHSPATAQRELLEYLQHGVTTVRHMTWGDSNATVLDTRAKVAAGTWLGPRIYAAGRWMGPRHYSSRTGWSIPPESIAVRVAAYRAAGYDFIKPHSESREVFDSVAAAARRLGLPLGGHVPSEVGIEQALASGMRSIEHLTGYYHEGKSEVWEDIAPQVLRSTVFHRHDRRAPWQFGDTTRIPVLAAATARVEVWNCPTQGLYDKLMKGAIEARLAQGAAAEVDELQLMQRMRRRLIKALQNAGAGLLLGTDAGPEGVTAELVAFVQAGLTPYQALATGTRNVAEYFGTLDSSGTIAVGKRADLVLLDGNPLEDVHHTAQPIGVMANGQWLTREELNRRLADTKYSTGSRQTPTP